MKLINYFFIIYSLCEEMWWYDKSNESGISKKCLLLLYHSWVFNTEEDFQETFSIFYTKFCVYEQAKDFIDEKLV